ncbi:ribbon-helix-helix protein, CopG family [Streptomyces sp. HPF1205]|uniref:ribbon-helix-helix protein, CopG family n=1 Tax=Streptomyces sp. HPF1205 TaxID=2873262 RepID=UPI001CEDAC04|nr:ribbon-helix-helix protein, CopG family [Streptomyces sp. HPF1205]
MPKDSTAPASVVDTQQVSRLSVNINQDTAEKIRVYRKRRGVSITETIRRAVAILALLDEETAKDSEVLIKSKDGKNIRQLWMV